jgi:hypothetical protein
MSSTTQHYFMAEIGHKDYPSSTITRCLRVPAGTLLSGLFKNEFIFTTFQSALMDIVDKVNVEKKRIKLMSETEHKTGTESDAMDIPIITDVGQFLCEIDSKPYRTQKLCRDLTRLNDSKNEMESDFVKFELNRVLKRSFEEMIDECRGFPTDDEEDEEEEDEDKCDSDVDDDDSKEAMSGSTRECATLATESVPVAIPSVVIAERGVIDDNYMIQSGDRIFFTFRV